MLAMPAGYLAVWIIGAFVIFVVICCIAVDADPFEIFIFVFIMSIFMGILAFFTTVGRANARDIKALEAHTGLDVVRIYNNSVDLDCFDRNSHVTLNFKTLKVDGQTELIYFVDQTNYIFINKDDIGKYYPFDCRSK